MTAVDRAVRDLSELLEALRSDVPFGRGVSEEYRRGHQAGRRDIEPAVDVVVTRIIAALSGAGGGARGRG
jgi:hypothetical protein